MLTEKIIVNDLNDVEKTVFDRVLKLGKYELFARN